MNFFAFLSIKFKTILKLHSMLNCNVSSAENTRAESFGMKRIFLVECVVNSWTFTNHCTSQVRRKRIICRMETNFAVLHSSVSLNYLNLMPDFGSLNQMRRLINVVVMFSFVMVQYLFLPVWSDGIHGFMINLPGRSRKSVISTMLVSISWSLVPHSILTVFALDQVTFTALQYYLDFNVS